MPDLIIKISTPADLSGATATIQSFAQVEQAAAAVGASAAKAGQADLKPLAQGAQEAGKHLSEAEHEADHLLETLKLGVGIDIGHRVVESIAEIPRAFQEAIAEGVRYNASIETLGIQLGGAFRSADPAKYLNFSEARIAGEQALDLLRQKANLLGTDFHALAETFAINVPVLAKAGINDLQQQIDVITLLNQVAASKGIGGFQAQRDIIDILNGQGNRTLLGKELETQGISNESIKQAEQLGTLYDLLRDKLGAYGEAGAAAAGTFTAAQQRLRNETEQLYGEIAKPVFDELKDAYDAMAVEIAKPEVASALRGLGYDIASLVDAGTSLAEWAIENAGVLVPLATAVGLVSFALAAYKTAQIASIIGARLTALVAETEATTAQAAAVEADTVAIEANTAAKAANAEAGAADFLGIAGAGAGLGGAAAVGGTIAAGLLPGALIYGLRQHAADQEGEQDTELGQASNANSTKLDNLRANIAAATTDEEKTRARKALTDELADSQKALRDIEKQRADALNSDSGGEASVVYDYEAEGKVADLKVYIQLLERANDQSAKLAGSNPLARDSDGKAANALAAYQQSPEARLAAAETSGDPTAITDAEYDAKVSTRRAHLEKTYGLGGGEAEKQAQAEITAAEGRKEAQDDAKLAERQAKEKERDPAAADAEGERKKRDDERRAAVLTSETEQTAINEAKARGDQKSADELTRQRDIRLETLKLQDAGLGAASAHAEAERSVNALLAARDKDHPDNPERPHVAREPEGGRRERGEHERAPIFGYRDPNNDVAGGLHGGGLTSSGLGRGSLGPSTASLLLASLPGVSFNQSAAQGIAPALVGSSAGASVTTRGGLGPSDEVSVAALDAAKAGAAAAAEATKAAGALTGLGAIFRQLQAQFEKQQQEIINLQGQNANRS